jgi:hypothetical protein
MGAVGKAAGLAGPVAQEGAATVAAVVVLAVIMVLVATVQTEGWAEMATTTPRAAGRSPVALAGMVPNLETQVTCGGPAAAAVAAKAAAEALAQLWLAVQEALAGVMAVEVAVAAVALAGSLAGFTQAAPVGMAATRLGA